MRSSGFAQETCRPKRILGARAREASPSTATGVVVSSDVVADVLDDDRADVLADVLADDLADVLADVLANVLADVLAGVLAGGADLLCAQGRRRAAQREKRTGRWLSGCTGRAFMPTSLRKILA